MEKDCPNCKFELYEADKIPCKDCGMDDREYWQPKPQTNADRFRTMSDEEQQKCVRRFWEIEDFADWLQQPS